MAQGEWKTADLDVARAPLHPKRKIGNSEVEVLFTPYSKYDPDNGLNWISTLLSSTKQHVDMALFVF